MSWGTPLMVFLIALATFDMLKAVFTWVFDADDRIRWGKAHQDVNRTMIRLGTVVVLVIMGNFCITDSNYAHLRMPFTLWLLIWLGFGLLNAKVENEFYNLHPEYKSLGWFNFSGLLWQSNRVRMMCMVVLSLFSFLVFAPRLEPTTDVLVVSGCTASKCKWERITKEEFGGPDEMWTQARDSDGYLTINNTARTLSLVPVTYGGYGVYSATQKSTVRIPKGKSIQQTRPSYLMKHGPKSISTKSKSDVITRWELWCK